MRFHWFLPTNGDGRAVANVVHGTGVGTGALTRPASVEYLATIAAAAEQSGFTAALTPTGAGCEDAWLTTIAVAQHARRLHYLVAFRPGLISPTLAAHHARTYQRLTGGRLAVNIVTGGDPAEQRAYGDHLSHDERYARTAEFLQVFNASWDGPVRFTGGHYDVDGFDLPSLPAPRPPVYFGGSSPAALEVAAAHVDVHLSWGEPTPQLLDRQRVLRELAARNRRTLRFGVRLHVLARETADAAWAEADRLQAGMDPATVAKAQERFARMESTAQARMTELNGGRLTARARDLEIEPGLWAGVGLLREGAGTALVGSYDDVAAALVRYRRLGFSEFVLSGWPHVEEAYRVGELVLPRARALAAAEGLDGEGLDGGAPLTGGAPASLRTVATVGS